MKINKKALAFLLSICLSIPCLGCGESSVQSTSEADSAPQSDITIETKSQTNNTSNDNTEEQADSSTTTEKEDVALDIEESVAGFAESFAEKLETICGVNDFQFEVKDEMAKGGNVYKYEFDKTNLSDTDHGSKRLFIYTREDGSISMIYVLMLDSPLFPALPTREDLNTNGQILYELIEGQDEKSERNYYELFLALAVEKDLSTKEEIVSAVSEFEYRTENDDWQLILEKDIFGYTYSQKMGRFSISYDIA
ncbi:MAG: hypothetical protein IKQ91_05210 [Oscillospiraceae bacterium]|nr:hypothetical protein [Oscillospiraceae bacterium]